MLRCMSNASIRTCPPERHRDALELVMASVAPEQRGSVIESLRPVAAMGVDVFAGLAIAERQQHVVGAAWLQPQVGRTATLWKPVVVGEGNKLLARDLAQHALTASSALSTVLAQTLLDSASEPFADDLQALGFLHLADLKYLMMTVPRQTPQPIPTALRLVSPPNDDQLFAKLIVESYEATLDCPALEGRRDIHDVLAGYRTIGTHDPSLWFIVYLSDQPVGVLLLAPYPESQQWELVYLGILPRYRGQSFGRQVLSEVRYRAAQAGIESVVLAVDAANIPALRMYDEVGFVEWTRRAAYIKSIEPHSSF